MKVVFSHIMTSLGYMRPCLNTNEQTKPKPKKNVYLHFAGKTKMSILGPIFNMLVKCDKVIHGQQNLIL